jgi:signal transduction histidine kinase
MKSVVLVANSTSSYRFTKDPSMATKPKPILNIVRHSLLNLTLALLTAGFYAAGFLAIRHIFQVQVGASTLLAGVIIVIFLAFFYTPLKNIAQSIFDRIIPIAQVDPNRFLREYSLSLSNILNPELLSTTAIGLISEMFEIKRGFLFNVNHEKTDNQDLYHLKSSKGMGEETLTSGTLSADSPIAKYFSQTRHPLWQDEIDTTPAFNKTLPEEKAWLSSLKVDTYIPIYVKDEWIGLIALGPKISGEPYFEDDILLLRTLADQTAVALQNARLVESLTRVNNDFRRAYAALEQSNRQLEQSNRQLSRTHDQLEKLDRTKSDFIAITSHELRTPLTVIRGYTEMLLEDPVIKEETFRAKLINGIHTGIMRLHEIVDSMLDIASIDTRTMKLNLVTVSPNILIQSSCESLKKSASERNLTLQIEALNTLPSIEADAEGLLKVFHNLIVNAIKYTPDGGKVTVSGFPVVRGQRRDFSEDGIEIVVSDTGIGIDPEYHDLIFAKFYQTGELALHSTGKTKFKGAGPGLGLSVAKGIVEAHGGIIWVESPGYDEKRCPGSQFHVILPLRQKT